MARINVERKALTDPRFRILGNRLSPITQATKADVEHAFGLAMAIRVWEYASERGTDIIPGAFIEAIYEGLTDAMIEAELLDVVDERTVRVRGWVDSDGGWLERQRLASRAGGIARAAGSKRGANGAFLPASSSDHPADLVQVSPAVSSALTLTPALTPTKKELLPDTSIQPSAELDPPSGRRVKPRKKPEPDEETMRFFLAFYGDYPRHEGRMEALRAFVKLNPDKDLLRTISRDIQTRINSGKWQPDIPEKVQFIPLPASYLNGRRWEDGQFA